MNWNIYNRNLDDDTKKLLEISLVFLVKYFGYSELESERVLLAFLDQYSSFDEDAIHHESSYRIAAIAHYLITLKGDRNRIGNWLMESGHQIAPPEAREYFRKAYFKSP